MKPLFRTAFASFFLAGTILARATAINFDLDVEQGFNYQADRQVAVGFITSLTIGDTAFPADITVKKPTAPTTPVHVVAVLAQEEWASGQTDPISFDGRLSTPNKQQLSLLMLSDATGPSVQFNFEIFNYDPIAHKYYLAFRQSVTNSTLDGFVNVVDQEIQWFVATDPAIEVQSPKNYEFQVGIRPPSTPESLAFSPSSSATIIKPWQGAPPCSVTNLPAIQVTGNGATLRSAVNPGGTSTSVFFEYSTSPSLATKSYSNTNNVGSGTGNVTAAIAISGLAPQTTYYYRPIGSNAQGGAVGDILSFTTASPQFNLTGLTRTNGALRFAFANVSNGLFSVRGTTNLSLPATNWPVIGSATEIAPGQYQFSAPMTNAFLFYQLSSP